jgi:hypothetical protein
MENITKVDPRFILYLSKAQYITMVVITLALLMFKMGFQDVLVIKENANLRCCYFRCLDCCQLLWLLRHYNK